MNCWQSCRYAAHLQQKLTQHIISKPCTAAAAVVDNVQSAAPAYFCTRWCCRPLTEVRAEGAQHPERLMGGLCWTSMTSPRLPRTRRRCRRMTLSNSRCHLQLRPGEHTCRQHAPQSQHGVL
jgi:hypothetical protein